MRGRSEKQRTAETRFEIFFRAVSYASVFCGFSALWASGSIGVIAPALFLAAVVSAWFLEDSHWQIGERLGTALIVVSLPAFYAIWQLSPAGDGMWIAGLLARMILCLTAVKLLQKKSDRDWIFLYLMAFFEVLLAAGLSISALYLVNFLIYLFLMACAIIAFEIRKTARTVGRDLAGVRAGDSASLPRLQSLTIRRIPAAAVAILVFTVLLAIPLFFMLPRVGGAGLGNASRGLPVSGFSDKVTLGQFGRITEDDRVVMRVKFDNPAAITNNLYFRGIALDTFDNKSWSRSSTEFTVPKNRSPQGAFLLAAPSGREDLVAQTIFLEPIETSMLFALSRPVAIRGNFDAVGVDASGSVRYVRPYERISYRVVSDTSVPPPEVLRADRAPYTSKSAVYRTLPPVLDRRMAKLAEEITVKYENRFDKARAVEHYLQTSFGYTLEQKAQGPEPLAEFLFNVKEGHCEYFASAMAILLRTQGIATRVVNGFHGGDYNEPAGVTVVRQRHAHAWVEVYFPGLDEWVTFDPTPVGNQPGDAGNATGVLGTFTQYAEALEAMWIEYFVAFDESGQRGLRASAVTELSRFKNTFTAAIDVAHQLTDEWLARVKGKDGAAAAVSSIAYLLAAVFAAVAVVYGLYRIGRRASPFALIRRIRSRFSRGGTTRPVEFYDQLNTLLAARGLRRAANQTPLEFAVATNLPEALTITEMYQQVRFGESKLTERESQHISQLLRSLKERG